MTIEQILTQIRSSVHGSDMRQAIHDGIEKCYNERNSGGYNPVSDTNLFYSGIGLFSAATTNKPFDSRFMLIACGTESTCYQIAYDADNANEPRHRKKENGSWSSWTALS